ncbi:MAG: hypothetical protein ACSHYF_03330 [Verrucomicrobiaceae bacterium]
MRELLIRYGLLRDKSSSNLHEGDGILFLNGQYNALSSFLVMMKWCQKERYETRIGRLVIIGVLGGVMTSAADDDFFAKLSISARAGNTGAELKAFGQGAEFEGYHPNLNTLGGINDDPPFRGGSAEVSGSVFKGGGFANGEAQAFCSSDDDEGTEFEANATSYTTFSGSDILSFVSSDALEVTFRLIAVGNISLPDASGVNERAAGSVQIRRTSQNAMGDVTNPFGQTIGSASAFANSFNSIDQDVVEVTFEVQPGEKIYQAFTGTLDLNFSVDEGERAFHKGALRVISYITSIKKDGVEVEVEVSSHNGAGWLTADFPMGAEIQKIEKTEEGVSLEVFPGTENDLSLWRSEDLIIWEMVPGAINGSALMDSNLLNRAFYELRSSE